MSEKPTRSRTATTRTAPKTTRSAPAKKASAAKSAKSAQSAQSAQSTKSAQSAQPVKAAAGKTSDAGATGLDLSDVDHRVGQPVGGGQLWDPCSSTDIRRWVMAMDYPNPIHWDEEFARDSKFGGLVAPQSIAVGLDFGHGAQPACVGRIPNSHLIFGGEEWWFHGVPIRPGDTLFQDRRFHGYTVADTKFAGPTMFSHGDTTHRNQHGALVAIERSTAIRYLVDEAAKRGMYDQTVEPVRRWTSTELADVDKVRHGWLMSNREGRSPHFDEVEVGDRLPRRVIGPHSIASFTTEYRAFVFNTWGSFHWVAPDGVKDPWIYQDPGWMDDFGYDEEGATIDPRLRDGLYVGPSRGHIDADRASEVGMARSYGYGATMGAWCTDYLSFWAGHEGLVRHSKASFRGPAFEGDVTYFDAEVAGKERDSTWGVPLVQVKLRLTNQDGNRLVDCTAEVELPY